MEKKDNNNKNLSLKKLLWILIVLLLFGGFPILLNVLLQIKNPISQISIIGDSKDWLSFGVFTLDLLVRL